MLKRLEGRKEIIIEVVAGLSLVLASAGVAPKFVAVLDGVAAAARAGDVSIALPAFAAGIAALARACWRAKLERDARKAARSLGGGK